MRVRLLAPFMLPQVLEEAWSHQDEVSIGGSSTIGQMLAELDAWMDTPVEADLVIEDHAPGTRAALLSRRARAEVKLLDRVGTLYISALGIAAIRVDVEVRDLEELRTLEAALRTAADHLAARTAEVVRRHQGDRAPAAFEGRVMWWHRLMVRPSEETCASVGIRPTGEAVGVGDGYTYVPSDDELDAAAEGLLAVTEEWILVDHAYRDMLGQMARMRRASKQEMAQELDALVLEGVRMAADLEFRLLVLGERARYLTNTAAATRESAIQAWRLEEARNGLRDQVASVRSVAADARDALGRTMDVRRNKLLYLFTVIAALQGGFVLFDFLVAPDSPVTSTVRVAVATMMFVIAIASVVAVVREGRRG
ncbi:hypothetical protein L1785_02020 [Antribacter sp. KLBMP9083]|uniref:Uncharacterized protein n=1 Tax=Antribacter soli TaxID=2910976 RepID=A0AA41QA91_9MICO|nr:hypothetical protein [Antribacter soli]MCF4119748.1 hypothetical protein [Antribacter soli]